MKVHSIFTSPKEAHMTKKGKVNPFVAILCVLLVLLLGLLVWQMGGYYFSAQSQLELQEDKAALLEGFYPSEGYLQGLRVRAETFKLCTGCLEPTRLFISQGDERVEVIGRGPISGDWVISRESGGIVTTFSIRQVCGPRQKTCWSDIREVVILP